MGMWDSTYHIVVDSVVLFLIITEAIKIMLRVSYNAKS